MKNALLLTLIEMLLKSLKPEMLKTIADKILDFVEEKVADSETEIDDRIVLPIVQMIRDTFGIED